MLKQAALAGAYLHNLVILYAARQLGGVQSSLLLRCCEAALLCARLWETPSVISAAVGEESSGSNTITGRLLLDQHTHVEHNVLCVGRSNPTTLPPCAQYILVPEAGRTWRKSQT